MTIYCRCDGPLYTERRNACSRCGLPVVVATVEGGSRECVVCDGRGCEFCPDVRRQETVDRLSSSSSPAWDEVGAVDVRIVVAVVGVLAAVVAVWLLWPYVVAVAVTVFGWRVATRHTRRRRPRSSWSSLGRTAAAMYAAYNSRWLKGSLLRATVPARVGREHAPCGECGNDRHDAGGVPF